MVRDGHAHLLGGVAETNELRPVRHGQHRDRRRRVEQHRLRFEQSHPRHLPKRIPHDQGLRAGIQDLSLRFPQPRGRGGFHEILTAVLYEHSSLEVSFRDRPLCERGTGRRLRRLLPPPTKLLRRYLLRGDYWPEPGTGHGAALPQRALHRLQAGRTVHASGIPHLEWTHRPRPTNRPLRLYYGVQAERNRRGGSAADRGERLCPTLRRRRPGSLQDRRELLFRDPQYREVAGWVKKSCFYPDILTLPIQYISYARRRYTSSGIEVYFSPKRLLK